MEELDTKSLVLDISSNLTRAGKFALKRNTKRARQFLKEIEECTTVLNKRDINPKFRPTLSSFNNIVKTLKSSRIDIYWADDAFTYSNILMHRVPLI